MRTPHIPPAARTTRLTVVALAIAAAVAALTGGVSLIGAPGSAGQEHLPESEPVARTSLACPYVRSESSVGVLAIADVDAPQGGDQPDPITARAVSSKQQKPDLKVDQRGVPVAKTVMPDNPATYLVDGADALAPGVAAETATFADDLDVHGLSTSTCRPPEREHWFVAQASGSRLVLANPTEVTTVVDVNVWGNAGPVESEATQDISIKANSQETLLLGALAPGDDQVAVHVDASQGRVAAAVDVQESDDGVAAGLSDVAPAAEPSTKAVVPAVPGTGERTLYVFAPGTTDALVKLKFLGPTGPFTPAGLKDVTVRAGSIQKVDLKQTEKSAVGVLLESDEPITASARAANSEVGAADVAYSSASAALSEPAAALLGRTQDGLRTSLHLSSVADSATRVEVQWLDDDGETADTKSVDVSPGATVRVPVARPSGATYPYVVVRPADDGAVVVGRQISGTTDDDSFIDLMPLRSVVVSVDVPQVAEELPELPDPRDQ